MKNTLIKEYGLNEQQALVVLNRDKELIVPAGAGSGKTKTLVTKVVALLKEGYDLDSFLVLTFTKKAAAEMKQRIKVELKNSNLNHLVNKIDSSNISTFDSFAYNFVKQNASSINLNNDIELLDPAIVSHVKRTIIEQMVMDIIENEQSPYYAFLSSYTGRTSATKFVENFIDIYDKLTNDKNIKDYNVHETLITNIFYNDFSTNIQNIDNEFYLKNIDNITLLKNYQDHLKGLTNYPTGTIKNFHWKDTLHKPLLKAELEMIRSLFKNKISRDRLLEIIANMKKDVEKLFELLSEYEKELTTFKSNVNKYEFNDIANFLNEILITDQEALKRLKTKTKFVFVDEYQDTSLVQSNFLNMLIENNDNINVLYVGDIKQSIYKFRDAKPETFIQKQETVNKIALNINYRSSLPIIKFVNNLFNRIMTSVEEHDINYSLGHAMKSGSQAYSNDDFANVYLIEQFSEDEKHNIVEEAFIIANKIKELYDNKITDKYSDFAILTRTKSNFHIIAEVFKYLNIPIQVQREFNLRQTYLLKLVANILSLSQNLNKENLEKLKFDYVSILRSELFEIKDFELFEDVTNVKFNYLNEDTTLFRKLTNIKNAILVKSNVQIIETIIKEFNIYEAIAKAPKAIEKELQLEYLLSVASPLNDIGVYSQDFADYIIKMAYDEELYVSMDVLQDEDENSVKLTNIHQSKGLEYEILFLADLNRNFKSTTINSFAYSEDFGIVMRRKGQADEAAVVDELLKNARAIDSYSSLKEELRLLYTAITRAKRALYIIGTPKKDYSKLKSFNDYLYYYNMLSFIEDENIIRLDQKYLEYDYFNKLKDENNYYPTILDNLKTTKLTIKTKTKEEQVASISLNTLIDDQLKSNLEKGTILHEQMEYGEAFNKLKAFNFNNQNIDSGIVYKELPFYFEEKTIVREGIIDLVVEYENEIHIIDYKTYDIDPNKYHLQLEAYEKYLQQVFPSKTIKKYMYSIVLNKIIEVKENSQF